MNAQQRHYAASTASGQRGHMTARRVRELARLGYRRAEQVVLWAERKAGK